VGEIGSGESYGAELFLRRAGYEGMPIVPPTESHAFACDSSGCVGRLGGKVVAAAERWSAVIEDCARADVVLTPGSPPARVAARCEGVLLAPRRGRGDRGGVIDLSASEPMLAAAGGAGRPWRAGG
jgi:competence protein ComEC